MFFLKFFKQEINFLKRFLSESGNDNSNNNDNNENNEKESDQPKKKKKMYLGENVNS